MAVLQRLIEKWECMLGHGRWRKRKRSREKGIIQEERDIERKRNNSGRKRQREKGIIQVERDIEG